MAGGSIAGCASFLLFGQYPGGLTVGSDSERNCSQAVETQRLDLPWLVVEGAGGGGPVCMMILDRHRMGSTGGSEEYQTVVCRLWYPIRESLPLELAHGRGAQLRPARWKHKGWTQTMAGWKSGWRSEQRRGASMLKYLLVVLLQVVGDYEIGGLFRGRLLSPIDTCSGITLRKASPNH